MVSPLIFFILNKILIQENMNPFHHSKEEDQTGEKINDENSTSDRKHISL